ncbi:hypothetical protein FACS1894172_13300 [Spirochaetia bacterium]|nr:hypothetical protein FACS1894164_16800 [Spirochaetia bacterium]GHU33874.1 hypothetical protein FACS1894172_13300 [Spirochaetia bacterium]
MLLNNDSRLPTDTDIEEFYKFYEFVVNSVKTGLSSLNKEKILTSWGKKFLGNSLKYQLLAHEYNWKFQFKMWRNPEKEKREVETFSHFTTIRSFEDSVATILKRKKELEEREERHG